MNKALQKQKAVAGLKKALPDTHIDQEKVDIFLRVVPDLVAGGNAWLVKNGFQVYPITPESKTLEDRFLEITGGK